MMIDRTLNYGRSQLKDFLRSVDTCQTALDIGAGRGFDLAAVREVHPGARRLAIECFPPNIQELEGQGVEVYPLNIEKDVFPFAPESLDVIMANQIFEHTKELFWILHQVSRSLKVGGHFLLGVPNLASLHNRILLATGRQPSSIQNNSAHVRGFTKPDVLKLLNSSFPGGYRLLDFAGGNFYPFPGFVARPLARLLPTMAWAIFFHLRKVKPYDREFLDFPNRMQLETNFFLGD